MQDGVVLNPTTLLDSRGNPPNLGILAFPIPLSVAYGPQGSSLELTRINVYLKTAGPTYTPLESAGIFGVQDYVEYHYFMITAVVGEDYAVDWTMPDGSTTPATPVDAEVYFPAVPDPMRVYVNPQMLVREFVSREFRVERISGEQAILLRRKTTGPRCECFNPRTKESNRSCPGCYGTGFEGGYDVFPRILLRFLPAGARIQATEAGILYDASPRGHTPIVPEVADRDVFVRRLPRNTIAAYEVHNRTRQAKEGMAGIPTLQEFSLKSIERSHPVYRAMDVLLPTSLRAPTTGTIPGMPEG